MCNTIPCILLNFVISGGGRLYMYNADVVSMHVGPNRVHSALYTPPFLYLLPDVRTHSCFPTYTNLLPNPSALQGKSIDHFAILLTPPPPPPPSNTSLLVLCTDRKNILSSMTHWFELDQIGAACCLCVCDMLPCHWEPTH